MNKTPQQQAAEKSKLERLATYNNIQNDWTGRCRICGQTISGTLNDLKRHMAEHNDDTEASA